MNSKQRQTLEAIFTNPVRATIKWQDIEALLVAIGCEVSEGNGSRVRFTFRGRTLFIHRPHPKPDTKQYIVRTVREFLTDLGIKP